MILQIAVLLGVAWVFYDAVAFLRSLPQDLPWIGCYDSHGKGSVAALLKQFLRSVFHTYEMLEEGYKRYSLSGRAFVHPYLITGAEIMLPPTYLNWIHDQPESKLSSFEAHREFMRADWTLLDTSIIHEHIFKSAISKHLTRRLDKLEQALATEVPVAVETQIAPADNDWHEVDSYWCWKKTVLQVVSRAYVGDLCRDKGYLHSASSFNQFSMLTAASIGITPALVRPLIAPFLCLPDRYFHERSAQKLKPILKSRKEAIKGLSDDEIAKQLPDDLLTWAVQDAQETEHTTGQTHKTSLSFLAKRISVMNFVSIDSTTITLTNVIFDILCNPNDAPTSDPLAAKIPLIERVRAEIENAQADEEAARAKGDAGVGNRSRGTSYLEHLPLLEACMKESFRMGNFISRSALKMVVQEGGVDVPGVGHVPKGVKVGIPLWGLHHDPNLYKDPYQWKGSRWLDGDAREDSNVWGGTMGEVGSVYHPFGYRSSACPGRFFALRVVKLLLAHVLVNFDIEVVGGKRPDNPWIGVSRGPPMGRLRLRSRRQLADNGRKLSV